MAYGAAESADQERATRVSILIGPDGKIVKTYAVSEAEAHPGAVLADIG
jgi:peroxiredoxin